MSASTSVIHVHPTGQKFAVANDAGGWRRLKRQLGQLPIKRLAMEATGKFHRAAHRHLHTIGIPVTVVNPLRARLFAEACGKLAKTDAIDARMLALMAEKLDPEATEPQPEAFEAVQELARPRSAAVAERVALSLRRNAATVPFLRAELERRLKAVTTHIERLDKELNARIAADPLLAGREAILRSIPGFGPVNTTSLVAGANELGQISAKQITSLAGLAPIACDSGTKNGARHIRGGRHYLRPPLYMAALAAIRYNPDFKRFYQRLRDNGKPPKVAITAVMRKLIILANSLVAQNRAWTPNPPSLQNHPAAA